MSLSIKEEHHDAIGNKKWWDDTNTRLLLSEFKKYFELWRTGKINKKKIMWQKIADCLNEKGITCTPEQAENRFKNLQRGYRRSYTGVNSGRRRPFIFKNELSELYMETLATEIPNAFETETCVIPSSEPCESEEQQEIPEPPNPVFDTLHVKPRIRFSVQKRNAAKTSVDALLEIKELISKIEIRRQLRHEQSLRIATEKNEILRRKNELLEQILLRID